MTLFYEILAVIIVLGASFGLVYYATLKWSERKQIAWNLILISVIVAVAGLALTVLLLYLIANPLINKSCAALVWGVGIGFISGIANFKAKMRSARGVDRKVML